MYLFIFNVCMFACEWLHKRDREREGGGVGMEYQTHYNYDVM